MTLRLNGSTSGYVEVDSQAVGGNNTIQLPSSNGSANQFLKNGSTAGTLGWSSLVEDSSGRMLVGASTARSNYFGSGYTAKLQIEGAGDPATNRTTSLVFNENTTAAPVFALSKTRGTTVGSNTIVQNGDELGVISWQGADGTNLSIGAQIQANVDGTPGSGDMPGRIVLSTTPDGSASPVERMRITQAGHVGIGVTPTYRFDVAASAGNSYIGFHENTANTADDNLYLWRMGANATSASAHFLYCQTSTTQRFGLRGNGGLANFQANNVNLSDRNAKKDISPAAGTWDCIKEWEIVNYRYKDQPDGADLNLGVIAQQVAESCPEVITVFEEAKDDQPEKLGVKEQQMYWMAIKALQEAQLRIETLEASNADLAARLTALEANS